MNFYKPLTRILIALAFLTTINSCKKQDDWLNKKRILTDVTPKTLDDYQAILDFNDFINQKFANVGLIGSDNLYVTDNDFNTLSELEKHAYLWENTIWNSQNGSSQEWNNMFRIIEYANIVLDGIKGMSSDSSNSKIRNIKGQALFFRSIAYYTLSSLFCKTYDSSTADIDLGLPLRTTSDVNILFQRATLQETYSFMIDDAKKAVSLLDNEPLDFFRPGKYAAFALLSKIYLVMGDYSDAKNAANEVLSHHSALLDFNSSAVSSNSTYRFSPNGANNPEILFYALSITYNSVRPSSGNTSFVVPKLYNSYDDNDLRRSVFYASKGSGFKFRGGYTGSFRSFCGLATNEIYLIRAECEAREHNVPEAMNDINTLLRNRYKTGTFTNLTAPSADSALKIVLRERRKELPFTANLRWEDLRRLNKESEFKVTVTRVLNGSTYTFQPNSNQYALPIPENEILYSGIEQNL